ncbi:MAG: hypothetical protein V7638_3880 [Acidobacteriota bacterium]
MLGKGEMRITILDDGTIKTETGDMAGPAHQAADQFLENIARLAGGEVREQKIGHAHHHHFHEAEEGHKHTH